MKKLSIFLLFSLLYHFSSFAQYYFYNDKYYDASILMEGGVSLGVMQGITDIGANKGPTLSPASYDWGSTKPNAGLYFGITYENIVGARVEWTRGSIAGDDSHSNSTWVKNRNLNFKTSISEGSFIATFNPWMFHKYDALPTITPYFMAGFAYLSFYPRTLYKGQWVDLPPLHTEGQNSLEHSERKPYDLTQITAPVGVGIKYELSPSYNLRLEALYRYAFSDYLDDVCTTYVDPALFKKYLSPAEADLAMHIANRNISQNPSDYADGALRGTPGSNDSYFTINIKLGYVWGRKPIWR